ncbi:MAG TPA: hypothetical protein VEZ47_00425 [Gemmatirosa sp.]|nr:hypothetical protein [Gemmatirosa sp.]
MALTLTVGLLADLVAQGEDDDATFLRDELALVASAFEEAGLPAHREPERLPDGQAPWACDMPGYAGLHALRRVAAHLDLVGKLPLPLADDEEPTEDPMLAAYYGDADDETPPEVAALVERHEDTPRTFEHLVFHGDSEGYYLPVDFEEPGFLLGGDDPDEEEADADAEPLVAGGGIVGSSVRLEAECRRLAAALGVPADLTLDDRTLAHAVEYPGAGPGWQRYGVEVYSCVALLEACERSRTLRSAIVFV